MKEKQLQITVLQETLHKETEQTAMFEKKWIAAVLEMEKDGAVVNDKQRRITKLTKELELSHTKVS